MPNYYHIIITHIIFCSGLAGVYSISDHFCHEFSRGVEDVSKMARAVYGIDHFDRFSPTQIVKRFGQFLRLAKKKKNVIKGSLQFMNTILINRHIPSQFPVSLISLMIF